MLFYFARALLCEASKQSSVIFSESWKRLEYKWCLLDPGYYATAHRVSTDGWEVVVAILDVDNNSG